MSDSVEGRNVSNGQFNAVAGLTDADVVTVHPHRSQIPAGHYLDPEVFAREQRDIFQRLPIPLLLSRDLPDPGSYRSVRFAGRSIIVTRTKANEVKAFLNACSHRGSRLVQCEQATSGARITCPYHAWTYSLSGKLVAAPREDAFASFDKESFGLHELPSREAGGFIWVGMSKAVPVSDETIGADLIEDFDAIGLGRMREYRTSEFELRANWKLVTDAFLEAYHVTRLHAKTLARFFIDSPARIDRVHQHIRQSSGSRRGFSAANLSRAWSELRKSVVYSYIVFPSVILVTSPTYVSVVLMTPTAADRTRVRYVMLVDAGPMSTKTEELHEKSHKLMLEAFANEDFRAAELCQEGLETGALEHVTLGGLEMGVRCFHDLIEETLARGTAA